MSKRSIEIGILYSRTGNYSRISEACRTAAHAAIEEINSSPEYDFTFSTVERDPGGNVDQYEPCCRDILVNSNARHIIGCITSWSRKELIPTLERLGGTLWYSAPYEGFEASDHIVYSHACPNQHLLPLLDWNMPIYGNRAYLTGSNYIWGWEMNRIARETICAAGGEIVGERCIPLGSLDVDIIIDDIRSSCPNFILNSLVGETQNQFLKAFHELRTKDARFGPAFCPILSCNMTEDELPEDSDIAEGLIAAGPYFRGSDGWPDGGNYNSSLAAATFSSVRELARLMSLAPSLEQAKISDLLKHDDLKKGRIDRNTHHTKLSVLIAQVVQGKFEIIRKYSPVFGDPFLSHQRNQTSMMAKFLRVLS